MTPFPLLAFRRPFDCAGQNRDRRRPWLGTRQQPQPRPCGAAQARSPRVYAGPRGSLESAHQAPPAPQPRPWVAFPEPYPFVSRVTADLPEMGPSRTQSSCRTAVNPLHSHGLLLSPRTPTDPLPALKHPLPLICSAPPSPLQFLLGEFCPGSASLLRGRWRSWQSLVPAAGRTAAEGTIGNGIASSSAGPPSSANRPGPCGVNCVQCHLVFRRFLQG